MYNLLVYLITRISVVIMYHKGERTACLFNCYCIRYVLNTQTTPSAQIRTGRYSFVKLKICKLDVCCAVESVFVNLSVQNSDLLSSAILKPVSQPLVICSEASGWERRGWQISFPILSCCCADHSLLYETTHCFH